MSRGEAAVAAELDRLEIEYIEQHVFDECKGKSRRLPFDFYLPKLNIVIEFQGAQHRKAVFSKKAFQNQLINDTRKKDFCRSAGIRLIEINSIKEVALIERLIEPTSESVEGLCRLYSSFIDKRFQNTF